MHAPDKQASNSAAQLQRRVQSDVYHASQAYLDQFTGHDLRLVALAMATGLLASIVSIGLFKRATATRGRPRLFWLGLNAVACGYGIYATHSIAMLAASSPTANAYDFGLALLSLVVAILATGIGVAIALRADSPWSTALGGAVVGLTVSAIHAIEVLAFDTPRARRLGAHQLDRLPAAERRILAASPFTSRSIATGCTSRRSPRPCWRPR